MTPRSAPIDCREALRRLYEYLDGELTPQRDRVIRDHLAACAPCFAHFNFEGGFLRFIASRTRAQRASPELTGRILDSLVDASTNPS